MISDIEVKRAQLAREAERRRPVNPKLDATLGKLVQTAHMLDIALGDEIGAALELYSEVLACLDVLNDRVTRLEAMVLGTNSRKEGRR
jgi:hypothetical protein